MTKKYRQVCFRLTKITLFTFDNTGLRNFALSLYSEANVQIFSVGTVCHVAGGLLGARRA